MVPGFDRPTWPCAKGRNTIVNQTKRAMAMTVIVAVAALLPRSHLADGNNANDPKPPVTNREILRLVNDLRADIIKLQATVGTAPTVGTPQTPLASKIDALQAVAAKRGVAILQVVPRTSGRTADGAHYFGPRYFVMGSTIQGFHHTVAFGTEITQSNPNHTLPAGSYMFETQQPRPLDDDVRCAIPQPFRGHQNINRVINYPLHSLYDDAMFYEPAFGSAGSTTATSTTSTSTNPSLGTRCRSMRIHLGGNRKFDYGAAVLKFDGTQGFEVVHRLPPSWITAKRRVSSYYGSVRITKLE